MGHKGYWATVPTYLWRLLCDYKLAKRESTLDMVNLEAWCLNTRILMSSFMWVDLSHVYREHNRRADILSKEGLHLAASHLLLTEYFGNEIIGESSSQLF